MKLSELQIGEAALMFGAAAMVRTPSAIIIGSNKGCQQLPCGPWPFEGNELSDMDIEKVDPQVVLNKFDEFESQLHKNGDLQSLALIEVARTQYVK